MRKLHHQRAAVKAQKTYDLHNKADRECVSQTMMTSRLGTQMKINRLARGISIEVLAHRTRITRKALKALEKGKMIGIELDDLAQIAKVFG
jgi:ribosome-binding protein aMBF1 (putative translation factor)